MKNGIVVAFLAACIVIAGCAANPAKNDPQPNSGLDNVDQYLQHGFLFKLGHSRSRIVKNLGKPSETRVERVKEPNPYNPRPADEIRDEVIELVYDGLTATVYRAAAENQELLQQVTITSSKYQLRWDLNVGAKRDAVFAVLGEPSEEHADLLVYKNRSGTEASVTFHLKDDRIAGITWRYEME